MVPQKDKRLEMEKKKSLKTGQIRRGRHIVVTRRKPKTRSKLLETFVRIPTSRVRLKFRLFLFAFDIFFSPICRIKPCIGIPICRILVKNIVYAWAEFVELFFSPALSNPVFWVEKRSKKKTKKKQINKIRRRTKEKGVYSKNDVGILKAFFRAFPPSPRVFSTIYSRT